MTACEFTTEGRAFVDMNGSHQHYRVYQNQLNAWKSLAVIEGRRAKVQPVTPPVVITAFVHRVGNQRSDAHNVAPTIKMCIDAAVDCGVIPNDSDHFVQAVVIKRGPNRAKPAITLRIESASAAEVAS